MGMKDTMNILMGIIYAGQIKWVNYFLNFITNVRMLFAGIILQKLKQLLLIFVLSIMSIVVFRSTF